MGKYVRTENRIGERLEPSEEYPDVENEHWLLLTVGAIDKFKEPILAESNVLGKLCDECVVVTKDNRYHSILKHVHTLNDNSKTGRVEFKLNERVKDIQSGWICSLKEYIESGYTIYGAIWTNEGLTYVAKMIGEDDLKLLEEEV